MTKVKNSEVPEIVKNNSCATFNSSISKIANYFVFNEIGELKSFVILADHGIVTTKRHICDMSVAGGTTMMNLKETINFKTLREKGPSSIDISNDEVVQLVTRGSDIKVILTQEYFLTLLSAYNNLSVRNGDKEEKKVNIEDRLASFEEKMNTLLERTLEDEEAEECKITTGQKRAGNF